MSQFELIKERFKEKGLSIEVIERTSESMYLNEKIYKTNHKTLKVSIPAARNFKTIFISDTEDLSEIELSRIETFRFLDEYQGVWSEDLGIIECELIEKEQSYFLENNFSLDDFLDSKDGFTEDGFTEDGFTEDGLTENTNQKRVIDFSLPKSKIKIFLGDCSNQFALLERLQRKNSNKPFPLTLSIRIEGIAVKTNMEATALLIKLSNAIFFQFDLKTHIPLRLASDKKYINSDESLYYVYFDEKKFQAPKFEYDEKPLSLYLYARSSPEMPLLQYLAYYQVLEFYFPMYSLKDATFKIQNFIKDPLFDVNKESDITNVINIIKTTTKGRSIGDDRSQIKSTILGIVDQETLLQFYNETPERKDFFDQSKKSKAIAKQKINFSSDNDIRIDTASRIYEIRCRVVHSKDDENFELLLPHTREVLEMSLDIQLIKFLAQRAIIAASKPLLI